MLTAIPKDRQVSKMNPMQAVCCVGGGGVVFNVLSFKGFLLSVVENSRTKGETTMRAPITMFWNWFLEVFRKPKQRRKPVVGVVREDDQWFHYRTIKELLNDLDLVFRQLGRMRSKRSHVQKMIRKFGPYVAPAFRQEFEHDQLTANFVEGMSVYGLPAFFTVYIPQLEHERRIDNEGNPFLEVLYHAQKTRSLPHVGCRKGKVFYEITAVIMPDKKCLEKDTGHGLKFNQPFEHHAVISVDKKTGYVEAVKLPIQKQVRLLKKGPSRIQAGRYFTITQQVWDVPDLLDVEETDHGFNARAKHIQHLFCIAYNVTMMREMGINIIVKKGDQRATFTVPQNRWKYFFKNRIKAKSVNGNTRPIFHSVVAHKRHLASGKTSFVKTHYRGLRHFWWDGFEIRIVMQGKHALAQSQFNVESDSPEFVKSDKAYTLDGRLADNINRVFEGDLPTERMLDGVEAEEIKVNQTG
jgi:hypothetical protein